jgi:acyl-CoA hydrolase
MVMRRGELTAIVEAALRSMTPGEVMAWLDAAGTASARLRSQPATVTGTGVADIDVE